MADPIRDRLLSDAAARSLRPLEAYQRLFPGREAEVARAWHEVSAAPTTGGSSHAIEDATRATIALESLRAPGHERLRLGEPIGAGGMGEVVAARDEVLRRPLALKRVRLDDDGLDPDDPDGPATQLVRRLLEEAQVTAQLDHPGVVPVHELGLDARGRPYFTMKRVHGQTLDELFRKDREGKGRSLARTLQVFLRICETLSYAHRKGVVHRDIKPANVMIGRFGEVYVMDWGLAKLRGEAGAPTATPAGGGATEVISTHRSERLREGAGSALTMDDQVVGTVGYLAPEQLVGAPLDERADLYAVGAMLYELLAGHAPYGDPGADLTLHAALLRMVKEPPTPLATRAPDAPPELVAIAEKAMARDPAARFSTAQELGEELHAFLEGRVVRSHRTGVLVELRKWVARNRWLAAGTAGVLVVAAAATAAFVAQQRQAAVDVGRERDRAQLEATRAQAAGRRADGLRLAAQSRLVGDDPGLSLALAVEAARRAPGAASTSAVYHALRRHREWRCFLGHESYLSATTWTGDGTRLLSGDESGLVVLWDVAGDAPLRWLEGPKEVVLSIAVEPGDRRAAVAYLDGPVRVWDLERGGEPTVLDAHAASVAFLGPDRLVVAGAKGATEVVEPSTGRNTVLDRRPAPVQLADGIGPGTSRVVVTAAGVAVLLDPSGGPTVTIEGPPGAAEPRAVVCTAAGEVAVRWDAHDARTYDLVTGAPRRRLGGGTDVESVGYAGDGSRVALGLRPAGSPPRVDVEDARSGAAVAQLPLDGTLAVRLTRDGRGLVAIERASATWVELTGRPRIVPLRGHRYTLADAAISPDGTLLATGAHDLTARVWSLRPADERVALVARTEAGHRVVGTSQDGARALVAVPGTTGGPTVLDVVDTATGRVVARFEAADPDVRGGLDETGGQAWWLAGRAWRVADVATATTVRASTLAVTPVPGSGVFPSPDGRLVLVMVEDGVAVCEQVTGADVGRLGRGRLPVRPAWAPDGVHVVGAHPPLVRTALYRYDREQPLREFLGHSGWVTDAREDARGRFLLSVAADTSVRSYDPASGRALAAYRGLPLRGARLVVAPAGDLVAVLSSKIVLLRLGDDGSLRETATLDRDADESLTFHPDGRRFSLVDDQQRVRTFEVDAAAQGRAALRRPVLPTDGVTDYEPDPADPLDAAWLARPDPWWAMVRAERQLAAGDLDAVERTLSTVEAARPKWPAPDLMRVRVAALRATRRGDAVDVAAAELARLLARARERGADTLGASRWHEPPAELRPYREDPRVADALKALGLGGG
ncbi:MAG: protein kinase [Planctomycetes bacterium]|nr:protein kinase [Planctomycetota bacterium]